MLIIFALLAFLSNGLLTDEYISEPEYDLSQVHNKCGDEIGASLSRMSLRWNYVTKYHKYFINPWETYEGFLLSELNSSCLVAIGNYCEYVNTKTEYSASILLINTWEIGITPLQQLRMYKYLYRKGKGCYYYIKSSGSAWTQEFEKTVTKEALQMQKFMLKGIIIDQRLEENSLKAVPIFHESLRKAKNLNYLAFVNTSLCLPEGTGAGCSNLHILSSRSYRYVGFYNSLHFDTMYNEEIAATLADFLDKITVDFLDFAGFSFALLRTLPTSIQVLSLKPYLVEELYEVEVDYQHINHDSSRVFLPKGYYFEGLGLSTSDKQDEVEESNCFKNADLVYPWGTSDLQYDYKNRSWCEKIFFTTDIEHAEVKLPSKVFTKGSEEGVNINVDYNSSKADSADGVVQVDQTGDSRAFHIEFFCLNSFELFGFLEPTPQAVQIYLKSRIFNLRELIIEFPSKNLGYDKCHIVLHELPTTTRTIKLSYLNATEFSPFDNTLQSVTSIYCHYCAISYDDIVFLVKYGPNLDHIVLDESLILSTRSYYGDLVIIEGSEIRMVSFERSKFFKHTEEGLKRVLDQRNIFLQQLSQYLKLNLVVSDNSIVLKK